MHAELEVKKNCKSCQKSYPQEYITPVPKNIWYIYLFNLEAQIKKSSWFRISKKHNFIFSKLQFYNSTTNTPHWPNDGTFLQL